MAERAFITPKTLRRVERGDASVAVGIYAMVLFVLGLADRVGDLADGRAEAEKRMFGKLAQSGLVTNIRPMLRADEAGKCSEASIHPNPFSREASRFVLNELEESAQVSISSTSLSAAAIM